MAVSLFFALAGLLLLGIARQLTAIDVVIWSMTDERGTTLRTRWDRLASYMLLGGMLLLSVLLLITYAIVARIEQRFAVFG